MKRLLFALLIMALGACAFAQETSTDYIYSPDGFVRIAGKVRLIDTTPGAGNKPYTESHHGLYSKDLKVLVRAEVYHHAVYVVYGTETIGSRAFPEFSEYYEIYIPSTVKYIASDAFPKDINCAIHIYDECKYDAPSKVAKVTKDDAEEKARYNIQGMKVDENAEGIQIIQYSDGTSKKVLVDPR